MAKTASDLAKQVLRDLVKLDAIEEPSAEDSDYIQSLSATYHDTLWALKVNVTWDASSIPEKVFFPLAGVLADVAARSYGKEITREDRDMRVRDLKAAAAYPYLGQSNTAEYM